MKRPLPLALLCLLLVNVAALAADEPKPITKVMLARLGWVQALTRDLAYSDYAAVAKDAGELAAQTKKVGESATAPFSKETNLAVNGLAVAMAEAAGKQDGVGAAARFGELLGKCNSCHAKVRDKQ